MASQSPFFGKREREPDNFNSRPAPLVTGGIGSTPVHPSSSSSSLSAGGMSQPASQPAAAAPAAPKEGSKLTVGPNIKLKGVEITDCDTLVVEGLVEATMDSRVIQISEQGEFKGSAHIDIAEIRGVFDGNLIVRDKLVIHSTGRVTGKIRYGKIVIEEGGQLSGEITFGAADGRKPSLQAA